MLRRKEISRSFEPGDIKRASFAGRKRKKLELFPGLGQFDCIVRWIGYPLALLAVFVLVGGHWAILQTVAWAGMLSSYTQTYGLADGVEKTFSGEMPCKMCVKVETGKKKEEQKLPLLKTEKKAESFVKAVRLQLPCFSSMSQAWPRPSPEFSPSLQDAPLSPPPQALS